MSAPVYFLVGASQAKIFPADQLDRRALVPYGLAEVFRDVANDRRIDWYATECTRATGPGERPGLFLTALPVESRAVPRGQQYRADDDSWQWTELQPGVLWIGVDQTAPVKPADVARRQQQQGHWVELGDGNQWLVPAVRRPNAGDRTITDEQGNLKTVSAYGSGECQLSQRIQTDPLNRRVQLSVRPSDQRIWDWSARFYDRVYRDEFSPPTEPISDFEEVEFAQALLSMNYRLGFHELNALGLLEQSHLGGVIYAGLDYPWFERAVRANEQKKT